MKGRVWAEGCVSKGTFGISGSEEVGHARTYFKNFERCLNAAIGSNMSSPWFLCLEAADLSPCPLSRRVGCLFSFVVMCGSCQMLAGLFSLGVLLHLRIGHAFFISNTKKGGRQEPFIFSMPKQSTCIHTLFPFPPISMDCDCTCQNPIFILLVWIPVSFTFSRSLSQQLFLHFYYHTNTLSELLAKNWSLVSLQLLLPPRKIFLTSISSLLSSPDRLSSPSLQRSHSCQGHQWSQFCHIRWAVLCDYIPWPHSSVGPRRLLPPWTTSLSSQDSTSLLFSLILTGNSSHSPYQSLSVTSSVGGSTLEPPDVQAGSWCPAPSPGLCTSLLSWLLHMEVSTHLRVTMVKWNSCISLSDILCTITLFP